MTAMARWEWMMECSAVPSMACRWPELTLFTTAANMPRDRPSAELGSVAACISRIHSAASSRPASRLSAIRSLMTLSFPVLASRKPSVSSRVTWPVSVSYQFCALVTTLVNSVPKKIDTAHSTASSM